MGVGYLPPNSDCRVHTYTDHGRTKGADESDCGSWESSGKDILSFYAVLKNITDRAVTYDLRKFFLADRRQRKFGPVNVGSEAHYLAHFLKETGLIPPHSEAAGWLTFDGRVTGLVAQRLGHVDRKQTLEVIFTGKHGTE
jgi:hypothetical protein